MLGYENTLMQVEVGKYLFKSILIDAEKIVYVLAKVARFSRKEKVRQLHLIYCKKYESLAQKLLLLLKSQHLQTIQFFKLRKTTMFIK